MEETPVTRQKGPKPEPQFIPKLKDKLVKVIMHDGEEFCGTLVAWNRYEILVTEIETAGPVIIMKNFIALIVPLEEEDPFTPKPTTEAEPVQSTKPSEILIGS